jgi:hypothetical protein
LHQLRRKRKGSKVVQLMFEERISNLEKGQHPPGTILTRCIKRDGQLHWVLAIGQMGMVKDFFYGETIDEVLTLAEKKKGK